MFDDENPRVERVVKARQDAGVLVPGGARRGSGRQPRGGGTALRGLPLRDLFVADVGAGQRQSRGPVMATEGAMQHLCMTDLMGHPPSHTRSGSASRGFGARARAGSCGSEGRSCPAPDDHCQRNCSMQMSWRCSCRCSCSQSFRRRCQVARLAGNTGAAAWNRTTQRRVLSFSAGMPYVGLSVPLPLGSAGLLGGLQGCRCTGGRGGDAIPWRVGGTTGGCPF